MLFSCHEVTYRAVRHIEREAHIEPKGFPDANWRALGVPVWHIDCFVDISLTRFDVQTCGLLDMCVLRRTRCVCLRKQDFSAPPQISDLWEGNRGVWGVWRGGHFPKHFVAKRHRFYALNISLPSHMVKTHFPQTFLFSNGVDLPFDLKSAGFITYSLFKSHTEYPFSSIPNLFLGASLIM